MSGASAAADRFHAARVRLLAAGMARRIDAIPADCPPLSRRSRIAWAKKRAWYLTASLDDRRSGDSWWPAYSAARRLIEEAMELEVPLTRRFPLPTP